MADLTSLQRLTRRRGEVWQGGLVRMPVWVTPPGEDPYRPWGGAWTSLGTGLIHMGEMVHPSVRNAAQSLDAFAEFALNTELAGYLPEKIEVIGSGVAPLLESALAPLGIGVVERDHLRGLEHVLEVMEREVNGREPVPGVLEPPGVTVERVAAFAEAARIFFEAAPWRHLTSQDLVRIEEPRSPVDLRHLHLLGAGGCEFGLMLFDSPDVHEAMMGDAAPDEILDKHSYCSIFFGGIEEMPLLDSALFEDHGLAVARRDAYPWAMRLGPKRRIRRLDARSLALAEALLRALASTNEDEIDSGRWTRIVPSSDGAVRVTLALPDLVDPPERRRHERLPLPDRRAMERTTAEIGRFFEKNPPATSDDANRVLAKQFSGRRMDEIPSTASTPLEKAQDLCYEAFTVRGRRRVLLARKAIEMSPDCADAYVILAEQSGDPEQALRLYREGVAAGERALGPERLARKGAPFWADVTTRPYMRAVAGLAFSAAQRGDKREAIGLLQRLIDLNPGDNQGVRYPLAGLLLETQDHAALESLLDRYKKNKDPAFLYARALLLFREEGGGAASRRALRAAMKENGHVADLLVEPDEPLPWAPDSYPPGGFDEAVHIAHDLAESWRSTPGAVEWLRKIAE